MAAAAAVIVFGAMVLWIVSQGQEPVTISSAEAQQIWQDDTDATSDMAILAGEIDEIESSILAVRLGENGQAVEDVFEEIELELVAINNDLWKG